MQKIIILTTYLVLLVSGCVYKHPIQQGNYLSEEDLARIELGMDPTQVRYVLGTPVLSDPFHRGRWDYLYHKTLGGVLVGEYRVELHFRNERLYRIVKKGDIPATTHHKPSTK